MIPEAAWAVLRRAPLSAASGGCRPSPARRPPAWQVSRLIGAGRGIQHDIVFAYVVMVIITEIKNTLNTSHSPFSCSVSPKTPTFQNAGGLGSMAFQGPFQPGVSVILCLLNH